MTSSEDYIKVLETRVFSPNESERLCGLLTSLSPDQKDALGHSCCCAAAALAALFCVDLQFMYCVSVGGFSGDIFISRV